MEGTILGIEPLFPLDAESENRILDGHGKSFMGISIRVYIATQIAQGMFSNNTYILEDADSTIKGNVKLAYKYADELLNQEYENSK